MRRKRKKKRIDFMWRVFYRRRSYVGGSHLNYLRTVRFFRISPPYLRQGKRGRRCTEPNNNTISTRIQYLESEQATPQQHCSRLPQISSKSCLHSLIIFSDSYLKRYRNGIEPASLSQSPPFFYITGDSESPCAGARILCGPPQGRSGIYMCVCKGALVIRSLIAR